MSEIKKSKAEVQQLLKIARDDLRTEKENFSKCKNIEFQKCYAENIRKIEKIIQKLEVEEERLL